VPHLACPDPEPRKARSGAQFETASFLLLRNGDSGQKRFFGRHRIRRIALEQNLAAAAMQESVAPVFSCLACEEVQGVDRRFELKRRARGYKALYEALGDGIYGVIVRDDNTEALVVLRLTSFAALLK
jgi:hypothetical protein